LLVTFYLTFAHYCHNTSKLILNQSLVLNQFMSDCASDIAFFEMRCRFALCPLNPPPGDLPMDARC